MLNAEVYHHQSGIAECINLGLSINHFSTTLLLKHLFAFSVVGELMTYFVFCSGNRSKKSVIWSKMAACMINRYQPSRKIEFDHGW